MSLPEPRRGNALQPRRVRGRGVGGRGVDGRAAARELDGATRFATALAPDRNSGARSPRETDTRARVQRPQAGGKTR